MATFAKLFSVESVAHSNVLNHDSSRKSHLHRRRPATTAAIAIPMAPPVPVVQPKRSRFGEQQIAILFDAPDGPRQVDGPDYERVLRGQWRLRKLRKWKNGFRKTKSGRTQRYRTELNRAPLFRETVTQHGHFSELLSKYATEADLVGFGRFLSELFERLTGWIVIGGSWHLDTDNYHFDIIATDTDSEGRPLESKLPGAWHQNTGAAIDQRYVNQSIPVDTAKLSSEDYAMALEATKPGFRCFVNLELGLAADEYLEDWASKAKLVAELAERKSRYVAAALKRASVVAQLRNGITSAKQVVELAGELQMALGEFDEFHNVLNSEREQHQREQTNRAAEIETLRAALGAEKTRNDLVAAERDELVRQQAKRNCELALLRDEVASIRAKLQSTGKKSATNVSGASPMAVSSADALPPKNHATSENAAKVGDRKQETTRLHAQLEANLKKRRKSPRGGNGQR